jgi:hypothetical protein
MMHVPTPLASCATLKGRGVGWLGLELTPVRGHENHAQYAIASACSSPQYLDTQSSYTQAVHMVW